MTNLKEVAKARRKELGITQRELAQKLGVHQPAISCMESGGGTYDTALRVIACLGGNVSVSWNDKPKVKYDIGLIKNSHYI